MPKSRLVSTALIVIALATTCASSNADIYIRGHADLGVGFENGNLHLHIHAEDRLALFGGGTTPAGEYDPGELDIGVPNPSVPRPAGAQWNFLASAPNNAVWFLPQSSDSSKPFLGLGTEELTVANGWTTPLTWTFNSISTISGGNSSFALWQQDAFGTPSVFASSLVPTATGNSWTQSAFSHDHFNFGFTGEGIYDVNFTIAGRNATLNRNFSDNASFRFVTGSAIPEPSSLALLGCAAFGASLARLKRRRNHCVTRRIS